MSNTYFSYFITALITVFIGLVVASSILPTALETLMDPALDSSAWVDVAPTVWDLLPIFAIVVTFGLLVVGMLGNGSLDRYEPSAYDSYETLEELSEPEDPFDEIIKCRYCGDTMKRSEGDRCVFCGAPREDQR